VKLRANLLCILGAVIGVASLYSVWAVLYYPGHIPGAGYYSQASYTGFDLLSNFVPHISPRLTDVFFLSCVLLAAGTATAFLTPIGGVLQVAGSLYFLLQTSPYWLERVWFFNLRAGPVIGLIAGALTVFSIFYPIGPHCRDRPINLVARLLSISRAK